MRSLFVIIAFIIFPLQASVAQDSLSTKSPYKTSWTIDGVTFGAAIVVAFTASAIDDSLPQLSITEINALNKNDINVIDRINAGVYSKTQSTISDVLVGTSILSPLLFLFDDETRNDVVTISTMYLETVLFATFMPSYGKGGVSRIRPYVYGSTASLTDKQDNEARRSFFSGHATWAFATSIFFASVYTDYHPDSEYRDYVWGGAIGLASTVSILRVTSGAHFISDIVVGAAVGSSIGYLIPYIHKNNSNDISIIPNLSPNYSGFTLSFRLK